MGQITEEVNTALSLSSLNENYSLDQNNRGWRLVWEDNFDWNGHVDTNKWDFEVGGHGFGKSH